MHTKKLLRNTAVSIIGYVILLILQLVNRRVFITYLSVELLGYTSLFANIFSFINIVESGIGGIILFHLYKEISQGNQQEIGKLMYLYKWIYRGIALIVMILGIVGSLILPWIINDPQETWLFIYTIYALQLIGVLLGYFLSYRRAIFYADQKEYYCVSIDSGVRIVFQCIQIAALIIFSNFYLYIIVQMSTTIVANVFIMRRSNRDYPFLRNKYKITKEDIAKRNIVSDVKNFFVHRISYAIYSGTDSIVISAFLGIKMVALYSNYYLLQNTVSQLLVIKLLSPFQATIGNILYEKEIGDEQWNQFLSLNLFSHFLASYVGIGFFVFLQPTITLWLGAEFLMPFSYVIVLCATIYVSASCEIVFKYRSVFGDYSKDRNCLVLSAVVNLLLSISLIQRYGIVGVQIGTLFALFFICFGRIRFVVKGIFGKNLKADLLKRFLLFFVTCAEAGIIYVLVSQSDISVMGMIYRFLAWLLVPLAINLLIFYRNPNFKKLLSYGEKAKNVIFHRN